MKISAFKLNRKKAKKLDPSLKILFFAASRIQNEIYYSYLTLLCSRVFKPENELFGKCQMTFEIFHLRMLAGKLYEAWVHIDRIFLESESRKRKKHRDLLNRFREFENGKGERLMNDLLENFNKEACNSLRRVRNKLAFHFNHDYIDKQLAEMPDELEIIYATSNNEKHGQHIYYYAEAMLGHEMIQAFSRDNKEKSLLGVFEDIEASVRIFITFLNCLLRWIYISAGQDILEVLEYPPVEVDGVLRSKFPGIPCFLDS